MKTYLPLLALPLLLLTACGNSDTAATQNTQDDGQPMSKGKAIFNANCMQCHRLHQRSVGPALEGTMARWDNDTARISAFIHNSQEAISKGDPRAKKVYDENHDALMTPMPHLSAADINELIDYINKGVE